MNHDVFHLSPSPSPVTIRWKNRFWLRFSRLRKESQAWMYSKSSFASNRVPHVHRAFSGNFLVPKPWNKCSDACMTGWFSHYFDNCSTIPHLIFKVHIIIAFRTVLTPWRASFLMPTCSAFSLVSKGKQRY